jgi:DNA repair protein RecO (recombination protein O)
MDYSETSIIARIYTEQAGLQSYIAKGVRKKGARIKRNLFSPLTLVTLVANHKENDSLRVIREISCSLDLSNISANMNKTAIALYIGELLYRTVNQPLKDNLLFAFIEHSVEELENYSGAGLGSFPLLFTIGLSKHLGFTPHNNFSTLNPVFDMSEGHFRSSLPDHPYYFGEPLSAGFSEILNQNEYTGSKSSLNHAERNELLTMMLTYFRIHIPGFTGIKSIQILSDLLREA